MEHISNRIIPLFTSCLARLQKAIEQSNQFTSVTYGVIRNGPHVFTIGIRCESISQTTPEVSLSFGCMGFSPPDATSAIYNMNVAWHAGPFPDREGFSIYEANAGPFEFTGDNPDIRVLEKELPRMEAAMLRATHRGKPPSRLATFWRRLLHRCHAPQIHRPTNQPFQRS